LLLTDGVNNAGIEAPAAAAELAKAQGVKVYTIGAGTTGMAPVRVRDPFSGEMVLRPMPVEVDETTLQEIADRTGGQYFRAQSGEGLKEIFRLIDELERTEIETIVYTNYSSLAHWWILAGLLLLLLETVLSASALRVLP